MFPGRGRSSHPTPAKGGCVPRYAASERMPEPGVWQRKTAAAKPAAATVRDLSEEERPPPRWPGNERPAARERDSQGRAHNAPGTGPQRTASAPGAGLEGTAPGGPAVGRPGVSVRGLILRDDRRRDAAALADLVAALLGPGPDFRTALTAGPAPGAAAAATGGAGTACVLCVLYELLAQFLGVCRAHVDLIGGSVKGERNRLRSLDLTVMWKVTHDRHHCLLCHGGPALPLEHLFIGCQTYTRLFCLTIRQLRVSLTSSPRASQGDTNMRRTLLCVIMS